ncbi:hypothetical protein GCM10023156_61460 [Novipirellula rosea]|uniref:Uncharacterized protein n=1 Tax=Novipirellula rosea TaxID=1031540 RepID=A0ABP8NLT5_9BACT
MGEWPEMKESGTVPVASDARAELTLVPETIKYNTLCPSSTLQLPSGVPIHAV